MKIHRRPNAKSAANILASTLAGMLLAACVNQPATQPPVKTVDFVDVQRYAGTWYEIASFPLFFQRQCIANTQANYELAPAGKIIVHNQCQTKDGIDKADGIAEVVPNTGNSQLRVSFFRPFWGDYWIIALDPEYRWAVVGHPDRRYLWILSRTRQLPKEQLDAALEAARKQGYDLGPLRFTAQKGD